MNWDHLKTFLWLRSRLSRNQWRKAGKFAAVLRWIFLVAGLLTTVAGAIGGFLLGWLALGKVGAFLIVIVWGGLLMAFLFVWLLGVATEIQRSEAIDLQRLLHLPVSLKQVFFLNYLASLVTPGLIFALPAAFGLATGLVLSRGPHFLWLFPVVVGFVFAVTAWTYCLRGWLVALMVNKRRKRTIVMVVTTGAILIGQVPNIAFNNPYSRDYLRRHIKDDIKAALAPPPDIRSASTNGPAADADARADAPDPTLAPTDWTVRWPWAGLASFALTAAGVGGMRRGYRSTLRFYQGSPHRTNAGTSPTPRPVIGTEPGAAPRRTLIDRRLPWVSDQTSAMTMAFLRSALRAPEVKMALILPAVILALLASLYLTRGAAWGSVWLEPFIAAGIAAVSLFGVVQLIANMFGYDRHGFRALILTPVPRREILIAKNLALLPLAAGVGFALMLVAGLVYRLAWLNILAGMLQMLAGYVLLSLVGNYTSIRVAYRVAPGSLKPTKLGAKYTFLMLLIHLLFPVALLPLLVPAALSPILGLLFNWSGPAVNALASSLLLIGSVTGYYLSLEWTGALLAERERSILQKVTAANE